MSVHIGWLTAKIARAATAAPSTLSVQPWRFHAAGDLIEIRIDRSALPEDTDRRGRQVMISCGAALMNARLETAYLGREPVVRLLPAAADPSFLASVRPAGVRRARAWELELRGMIFRPDSGGYACGSRRLGGGVRRELADAAHAEGATLGYRSCERRAGREHQLAVLETPTDTPLDWLRTGQALQRVMLLACARGLAASCVPDRRRHGREQLAAPGYAQLDVRLGITAAQPRYERATMAASHGPR